MATDPSQPAPPPQPGPPPAPGPGASRDEWREWRHQQRDYMRTQLGRGGYYGPWGWGWFGGGWFWGAVLVLLGFYFLLANLGLLGRLRGDVIWPILVILLGVVLLVSRLRWWR